MADVFISYAREDRARADLVARNLASAGLNVFWDSEIPPGQTWADYVEDKLSKCKAVIVLWSENSTKSQWVREEARMGRDKGKLIPAMIDGSLAPFGFGEVQAANLANWNGQTDHPEWVRFASAVRNAVGVSAETPQAPAPTPAPQPMAARPATIPPPAPQPQAFASVGASSAAIPGARIKPIWWIAGAGGLALVVIVAFLSGRQPNPPQPNPNPEPVVTTTAAQGSDPQSIILAQVQRDQQTLQQQGFQMVGQPASGSLAQGQTWNMPVQLVPGVDYRLVGVCDGDCRDLDLALHDQSGAILAQDTATDDHPVVPAQTQYAGNFVIEVRMYNCSVPPCFYAVALYGRRM